MAEPESAGPRITSVSIVRLRESTRDARRSGPWGDGCEGDKAEFKGFALSLDAKSATDGERMFKALSDGGKVQQPLIETFFAERFGMLADKFGIGWMVVAGPKNP